MWHWDLGQELRTQSQRCRFHFHHPTSRPIWDLNALGRGEGDDDEVQREAPRERSDVAQEEEGEGGRGEHEGAVLPSVAVKEERPNGGGEGEAAAAYLGKSVVEAVRSWQL